MNKVHGRELLSVISTNTGFPGPFSYQYAKYEKRPLSVIWKKTLQPSAVSQRSILVLSAVCRSAKWLLGRIFLSYRVAFKFSDQLQHTGGGLGRRRLYR